jgi:hypothetical protein
MTISKAWTEHENIAIAALYFAMLALVLRGVKFNKRAMIRGVSIELHADGTQICGPLRDRSRQSIEAKLMNCTAVHELLDPNAMSMSAHGYRPLTRFQGSLRDAMRTEYQRVTADAAANGRAARLAADNMRAAS